MSLLKSVVVVVAVAAWFLASPTAAAQPQRNLSSLEAVSVTPLRGEPDTR
jgi:hypothetical protein